MAAKVTILALVLTVTLVGCAHTSSIAASELRQRINESSNHSGISWWYLGDDKNHYYIKEKWPVKEKTWKVLKSDLVLKDIPSGSVETGINFNLNFKLPYNKRIQRTRRTPVR